MRVLTLIAGVLIVIGASARETHTRYRVLVPDDASAQRIADSSLGLFSDEIGYETDLIVGPGQLGELLGLGLRYRFVSYLPILDPYSYHSPEGSGVPAYQSEYLRYNDIIAVMEQWRQQWPALIERQEIGRSIQNRPIWAYRLKNPNATHEMSIVFHGGIHAREWISPPVSMYIFERLLREALATPQGWELISRIEFSLIPVLNPDGYEYTWTTNRLWRKNRRHNGNNVYGVDLNRNYSVAWGVEPGSSGNPSSQTYRGTAPFSEPETRAIRDYLLSRHNVVAYFDYHSYSQLVLSAWSYTYDPPPDSAWLLALGEAYRQGILDAGGLEYVAGQGAGVLYLATGTSKDYGYEVFGAPSYTIELRDTGQNGFLLPPSEIRPTSIENWGGFRAFVQALLN